MLVVTIIDLIVVFPNSTDNTVKALGSNCSADNSHALFMYNKKILVITSLAVVLVLATIIFSNNSLLFR